MHYKIRYITFIDSSLKMIPCILQAIENGDLRELKVQVRRLNNCQKDKIEHLDVCEVLQDERCPTTLVECAGIYSSPKEGENRSYYMTLLAYAGYHGRIDMINHLISEGASK